MNKNILHAEPMYTAVFTIGEDTCKRKFFNKSEAIDWLLARFYTEIGSGDCENGGKGSLWNCAPEIHAFLEKANGGAYEYADVKISLTRTVIRYFFMVFKNGKCIHHSPFFNTRAGAEHSMNDSMKRLVTIDATPSVVARVNNEIFITHGTDTIVAKVEEKIMP